MDSTDSSAPSYHELLAGLTVAQAATISRRSGFLIRDDIRKGRLTAYKVGGRWRVLRSDLTQYLEALVSPARNTH